jgi:hypothetical protein
VSILAGRRGRTYRGASLADRSRDCWLAQRRQYCRAVPHGSSTIPPAAARFDFVFRSVDSFASVLHSRSSRFRFLFRSFSTQFSSPIFFNLHSAKRGGWRGPLDSSGENELQEKHSGSRQGEYNKIEVLEMHLAFSDNEHESIRGCTG